MHDLDLEALLDVERRGWDSLCASRGGRFYGELMTAGAVMVLVNGMVLDRETIRSSLDGSPAWDRYEIDDAQVVPVGADAAALVYRARAERAGEAPFVALMSSVYVTVDGQLRLALYQQTTIDA